VEERNPEARKKVFENVRKNLHIERKEMMDWITKRDETISIKQQRARLATEEAKKKRKAKISPLRVSSTK